MFRAWLTCLIVLLPYCSSVHAQRFKYDPEIYMNATGLITSKGYPCENHYVTTQDGFILNLQRIPHGRNGNTPADAVKPVVMLQHGLMGASSNFLLNLANESLAFILADAGADVWLGNVRGNTYSRAHKTLKPSDDKFWAWSYDEMVSYDLPAMIDHIVQTTNVPQIYYVGHSQGTMIGFAGFSQNKTLGSLVKTFVALAPVARVGHIKGPLRYLAPFEKEFKFFEKFGHGEFLPSSNLTKFLAKDVCKGLSLLCESFFFVISGFDYKAVNTTRVPVYVAHTPSGTSVQNMRHFGQGVNTDTFSKYDYESASENMKHYNQTSPPDYHPDQLQVPVVLFQGGKDFLADPDDVSWIRSQLKTIIGDHMIEHWEHLDFVLGMDAPQLCYSKIVELVLQ